MPIKTDNLGDIAPRTERSVPLLDEPDIGHLQAILGKVLDDLGNEAYGYNAIQLLARQTGVWLDPSQAYTSIRKLAEKGYLAEPQVRYPEGGGPPMKLQKLTPKGREALKAAAKHYGALYEFLKPYLVEEVQGKAPAKRRGRKKGGGDEPSA